MRAKRKHRRTRTTDPDERKGTPVGVSRSATSQPKAREAAGDHERLLTLQHSLGNRAVQGLVRDAAIQQQAVFLAPKGGTAKGSYDMGSPVSNASEIFYSISEPSLSKVSTKFKFKDEKGSKLAGQTSWDVRIKRVPKGGITKKGKLWTLDPIPWTIRSISVELPQWQNFKTASDADKKEWARFIKSLRIHEQGHVDRVRKFMNKDMPAEWKSARAPTVKAVKRRLRQLGGLVKERLKQISKKYDSDTSHGTTKGAALKPPTSP